MPKRKPKSRPAPQKWDKPRKSVVTLVVTHTLETKKALRETFAGIDWGPGKPDDIKKIIVRDVDFD